MQQEELAFTSARELRELIATKQVSPVEVTELLLRRIEALNPKLNAYLTVIPDQARAAARAAEEAVVRGDSLGPLHGIPVSIKDLYWTKEVRATAGSLIYKDFVAPQDSLSTERLRSAGAVILGQTNTPELGLSGTTENRLGDACRNPWDTAYTSGGSSGGAAAGILAGLCALALGSDGGGSIREPASLCGIYGIKPSQGRVPAAGGFGKPRFNIFSQAGPLTRTVADSALMLGVLAGFDHRDVTSLRAPVPDYLADLNRGVTGLRIAWSSNLGYLPVDPEVLQSTTKAAHSFAELGASVEEPTFKPEDLAEAYILMWQVQSYVAYENLYEEHASLMTDYCRDIVGRGKSITGADYNRALRMVDVLKGQFDDLFESYDLLLTPTLATPAFPVGQRPESIAGQPVNPHLSPLLFTFLINMTGHCAASIPCGFSRNGLPIGLQIIGRRLEEATVLRASATFESARPWAGKPPLEA